MANEKRRSAAFSLTQKVLAVIHHFDFAVLERRLKASTVGNIFMTLPSPKYIAGMYAVSIGLVWGAVRILAPKGSEFSFLRAIGAAILMTFFGNASLIFLNPLIGPWHILVSFLAYIIVAKALYKLAFWRCTLVALIYFLGLLVAYYFIFSKIGK